MSNLLNMTVINSAIEAAIAGDKALGLEAKCAAEMNSAYSKAGVADMTEQDRVAWLEGNLANLITGLFLGKRHAAKDKTFKKGASDGAIAQVQRMALLQAAGPTASQKDKKDAKAGLNADQLKTWADLRGVTSRVLKASNVPHPHPRAPKASTENETPEDAATGTGDAAPVKVAFSLANVTEPNIGEKDAATALAAFLELGTMVAHTYGKATQKGAVAGDLASLLSDYAGTVAAATRALRDGAEKVERAAAVAAAKAKADADAKAETARVAKAKPGK